MQSHDSPSEIRQKHMAHAAFRARAHEAVDWIADYLEKVESLPVQSEIAPGWLLGQLEKVMPEQGMDESQWDGLAHELDQLIVPALTNWQSPNFFGYFPANASGPAIIGEILSAGLNVNGMLWATSPAATELEMRVMNWLGKAIGLDEGLLFSDDGNGGGVDCGGGGGGGGVIQGTASESALLALVAARHRVQRHEGLRVYVSTQAHASLTKAVRIAGLGDSALQLIAVDDEGRMKPDELGRAIRTDQQAGLMPALVCATVGTTATTAVDPLKEIAHVLQVAGFADAGGWLHVDAAHLGAACICPEYVHFLEGVEHADSICFNPHKWLLTNFDCDCFWTRDRLALNASLSVNPEYLKNKPTQTQGVIDYRDWQIPLGRRFRALKLWLVLRHYGQQGLKAHIQEHMKLAEAVESEIRASSRFEMMATRTCNLVCFSLKPDKGETIRMINRRNEALLATLNESGRLFLTHGVLDFGPSKGRLFLRMAIGATRTEQRHVHSAWAFIEDAAAAMSWGSRAD